VRDKLEAQLHAAEMEMWTQVARYGQRCFAAGYRAGLESLTQKTHASTAFGAEPAQQHPLGAPGIQADPFFEVCEVPAGMQLQPVVYMGMPAERPPPERRVSVTPDKA
jgi:hypothetical protein